MTITLTRKEAQQVLDSLLDTMPFNEIEQRVHQAAIETLRTRLAQPEPEPVAWLEMENYLDEENLWDERKVLLEYDNGKSVPLYTAPPKNEPVIDKTMATRIATQLGWQPKKEWAGLTVDEMFDCLLQSDGQAKRLPFGFKWFAEAIETKLKEKNT